jgi:hypothetical protein
MHADVAVVQIQNKSRAELFNNFRRSFKNYNRQVSGQDSAATFLKSGTPAAHPLLKENFPFNDTKFRNVGLLTNQILDEKSSN